jgi:hypothetical protein
LLRGQVAEALLDRLEVEETFVRERFDALQRLDITASGLVAAATAGMVQSAKAVTMLSQHALFV